MKKLRKITQSNTGRPETKQIKCSSGRLCCNRKCKTRTHILARWWCTVPSSFVSWQHLSSPPSLMAVASPHAVPRKTKEHCCLLRYHVLRMILANSFISHSRWPDGDGMVQFLLPVKYHETWEKIHRFQPTKKTATPGRHPVVSLWVSFWVPDQCPLRLSGLEVVIWRKPTRNNWRTIFQIDLNLPFGSVVGDLPSRRTNIVGWKIPSWRCFFLLEHILKRRPCMEQSAFLKGEHRKQCIDWRHLHCIPSSKPSRGSRSFKLTWVLWLIDPQIGAWIWNMTHFPFQIENVVLLFCHKKLQ